MAQSCSVFNKTKKLFLRQGDETRLLGWSYEEGVTAYVTKLFYLLTTEWKDDIVIVQGDLAKAGDPEFISPKALLEYKEKTVKVPDNFKMPRYFCLAKENKGGVCHSYVDLGEFPELKLLLPFLIYNSNGRSGGDVNVYGDDLELFDSLLQFYNPVDLIVKDTVAKLAFAGHQVSLKDQKPKLKHPNDKLKNINKMLLLVGFYVDAELKQKYPTHYLHMLKQIRHALNTRQENVFNNIDMNDLEIEDEKVGNLVRLAFK